MTTHFKTDHQLRIESFMKLAGQELPQSPVVPDIKIRQLRGVLILEEGFETISALGFKVNARFRLPGADTDTDTDTIIDGDLIKYELEAKEFQENIDLVEIVDGCADISVVTIGTLSACGVSDSPILHEVDDNNLAKFGPGSYIRDDGKLVKPPDHTPPRIAEALARLAEYGQHGPEPSQTTADPLEAIDKAEESSHERETSSRQDNEISGERGSEIS